ncbi:unnamed protein product [Parnassius mnemosyne]|uniref:Uncharacterized protein n=1 Tax=Parnassius mnemosyne TaxID=213953 RepID=A0AAV1LC68_9NEOP
MNLSRGQKMVAAVFDLYKQNNQVLEENEENSYHVLQSVPPTVETTDGSSTLREQTGSIVDRNPYFTSDSENDTMYHPVTRVSETSTSENISNSSEEDNEVLWSKYIRKHVTSTSKKVDSDTLTRKRQRNPLKWKRNTQKTLRLAGKEYTTRSGNKIGIKKVKDISCKCHYNCNFKFSLQERENLLQEYLSLKSEHARWCFIGKCVQRVPVKRTYKENQSRRKNTLVYSLFRDSQSFQVCKSFFLTTFNISAKKVETALSKLTPSGVTEPDMRGKKEPPNKKSDVVKDIIRDHIKSLPTVSSHYCRSTTKRKYLPSGLSENRLYLDYVEYCKERQVVPEKASFYKFIFTNEFNYGFHRPKKDQCDHCIQFKNRPEHEQQLHKEEYDLHIIRKNEARKHKVLDKNRTKVDPGFIAFAMDLEKLLLAPNLQAGQVYYKRKLKIYNFTLYNLGDSEATNYMWHEGVGTKGASEIATCIWMHLSSLAPEIKEITLFSDTASGQNRNTIIAAMFLHAVTVLPIQTINQKFMESGHSEMECDSVHSAVENRGRHVDIYTPEGWYTVARTAKTTKPYYKIKELTYSDFIDFKSYSNKVITNKNKTDTGDNMNWLLLKWIQYRKESPKIIFFKNQLSEENFKSLPIQRKALRKSTMTPCCDLQKLYNKKLKISANKLKDLKDLCAKGTIPSVYHDFYNDLEEGLISDNSESE